MIGRAAAGTRAECFQAMSILCGTARVVCQQRRSPTAEDVLVAGVSGEGAREDGGLRATAPPATRAACLDAHALAARAEPAALDGDVSRARPGEPGPCFPRPESDTPAVTPGAWKVGSCAWMHLEAGSQRCLHGELFGVRMCPNPVMSHVIRCSCNAATHLERLCPLPDRRMVLHVTQVHPAQQCFTITPVVSLGRQPTEFGGQASTRREGAGRSLSP